MESKGSLIDKIKHINAEYSKNYSTPDAQLERYQFRNQYPIGLFTFGCMDGRNNIPNATELPPGIMQNYRYLGGAWEWWNYLD